MRKTVPDAETVEAITRKIPNGISISRMLLSLALIALSPTSHMFAALYVLCGISDVLDGFLARKLHSESEKGAMLDSAADLIFLMSYAVKILPHLRLPPWIWIWIGLIAAGKLMGILKNSKQERRLVIRHSMANRVTGALLFLFPLSLHWLERTYGAAVVCAAASVAAVREMLECGGKHS